MFHSFVTVLVLLQEDRTFLFSFSFSSTNWTLKHWSTGRV